jgi:hypothetical protein
LTHSEMLTGVGSVTIEEGSFTKTITQLAMGSRRYLLIGYNSEIKGASGYCVSKMAHF